MDITIDNGQLTMENGKMRKRENEKMGKWENGKMSK